MTYTPQAGIRLGYAMKLLLCRIVLPLVLLISTHANANLLTQKKDIPSYGTDVVAYGYARLAQQSVVHYTEQYLDDPLHDTLRASYWSSDRQLIAYKKLIFSDESSLPNYYELVDYRRGRGYRVKLESDIATVQSIKLSKNGTQYIYKNSNIKIKENTIIDAGFHRFIIANWQQLLNGETLKMKFLQTDKPRLVPLKIKKARCDTPDTACFKIKLDNFFLQSVVPTLHLKYDLKSKNLLRYTGIGPITKLTGKELAVDILYEYRG